MNGGAGVSPEPTGIYTFGLIENSFSRVENRRENLGIGVDW
ncbi:hypothetical protein RESH_04889 [Rhodopirellula europaea SH398]|uniref:Uncharacterized protein n=1 Tax=Rhodopirellula europaea SH398 TaxID=1263868 RepID=M5RYT4_9BACT|nr:hypothetical protein RESH_04889 [Rhodopirellula europaea SH398]